MRRPWYTYVLLFVGILFMLGALFRPVVGATSVAPGARVEGPSQILVVLSGSPLERAGARTGDRFVRSDVIQIARGENGASVLRWRAEIPRSGPVLLERNGVSLQHEVRPAHPWWPVRLLWMLLGLLNVALTALALALFWQRPRDGQAILLGLVLLAAPVFAFPREPYLVPLALAAHFFLVFPTDPRASRWKRRVQLAGLYLLLLFFWGAGNSLIQQGRFAEAARTHNTLALLLSGFSLARVLLRWRKADPPSAPVYRALTLAAGAIFAAVLGGLSRRGWVAGDQFIPANLPPALLFSAAMGHLVFRLRALEVRVTARRTLHYLLARWTLGTLFLIPGFLLVWRMGQLSVTRAGGPRDFFPLILWMFLTALLLGKRTEVLRNLDRRFFRDAYAVRQALLQLAGELGGHASAEEVLTALEEGIRRVLRPQWLRFAPETGEAPLVLPVRHGERLHGYLWLGPKESGEEYTGEERELLESVAAHAGTALETARLSAELLERQRAELAVRSAGVLSGAEDERRRLAADLHDQVLPELRAIAGEVEQLQSRANGMAPDLEQLGADVRGTMDSVREVMEALRPSALDMLGLWDALESLARRAASRAYPPVNVSIRRVGEEPDLTPEQSLTLYRVVQEAVQNALRHSGAQRIGLVLQCADGELRITVWDDGRGFDPALVGGGGRGLGNIRYRADLIRANVHWSVRHGGGTEVEVALCLGRPAREAS